MANYAVLDGINVLNTIVADSKEIAEEVTGKTCILFTENEKAQSGGTYENGTFIPPKPYPSWILNTQKNEWNAPVEAPIIEGKSYSWNEDTLSWVESI